MRKSALTLSVLCLCGALLLAHATPSDGEDAGIFSNMATTLQNLFSVNLNIDKWGYGMKGGPNLWKAMFPRGSMVVGGCNGNFQSPIALAQGPTTIIDNENVPSFSFPLTSGWVMYNKKNRIYLQRNPANGMGSIAWKGRTYHVRRVDLHKPAQHTVDGVLYSMEVDIHCTSDDGLMASVATFIKVDPAREYVHNRIINSHFDFLNMPKSDGDVTPLQDSFGLYFLFPNTNQTHYSYTGSQDHPPCIEGVEWIVMTEPNWMNGGDMSAFPASGNARPTQRLHGRKIYVGSKVTGNGFSFDTGRPDPTVMN
jgi:carbonic anhydrase